LAFGAFRIEPLNRAQRQQALGSLALVLPDVPLPDLRRVGRQFRPALVLGSRLLRTPPRQGCFPQRHHPRSRL